MTRYLISFDDGTMTIPEEQLPEVAKASHHVVQQARTPACGFSPDASVSVIDRARATTQVRPRSRP